VKDIAATNINQHGSDPVLTLTASLTTVLIVAYAFSLSLPITIPWTILILGIIVMGVHLAISSVLGGGEIYPPAFIKAPFFVPLLIFAIAVTLSGAANGGLPEAFKSFCSLRGFLVYFWAYWAFTLNNNLKKLSVAALLIAGAVAGLWATIEQLTGFHPFSYHYMQGTGFLSAPMAFSGLAQIFSLLALGIALKNGRKQLPLKLSNSILFYIVLACNWLGVIFAAERSAWLGTAAAVLTTCFLISHGAGLISGSLIAISSIAGWLTLPVVHERLSSLSHWQTDVSVSTRVTLWHKAWETFQRSPIFGCGIRQFPHMYIPEALQQGHTALDHAHSNYLHILATTGVIGFIAYLYLWFSALKISYLEQKDFKYPNLDQGIYLGIFAGTVSLVVSGLFEYNFGTAQVRLAQWFVLAILVV
jgi:O-antigen ligase